MYFPDSFAGLTALRARAPIRIAVAHRDRAVAPQTAGTLTETPPERWGLSVVSVRSRIDTTVDGRPGM